MSDKGWIGVDLDGTLAHYDGWDGGGIGKPIGPMVERVKAWLEAGTEVRIVTARVSVPDQAEDQVKRIGAWCEEHVGRVLPVTCCKDYAMVELWDDRAVQVIPNTGLPVSAVVDRRRVV